MFHTQIHNTVFILTNLQFRENFVRH